MFSFCLRLALAVGRSNFAVGFLVSPLVGLLNSPLTSCTDLVGNSKKKKPYYFTFTSIQIQTRLRLSHKLIYRSSEYKNIIIPPTFHPLSVC